MFDVNLNFIFDLFGKRDTSFTLNKFIEDKCWKIRILHPNKTVERCSVYLNKEPIHPAKAAEGSFEYTIEQGGGCNFPITSSVVHDDATIEIKSNGKKIKKIKFKDIERAR